MVKNSFIERCENSGINVNVVSPVRKKFVLLRRYLETGFISVVAFGDSYSDLCAVMHSHLRYGSCRNAFFITENSYGFFGDVPFSVPVFRGYTLNSVKDLALINICKNVSELLSVGEYAMLKKSYFKSSAWFEKAKNSASLGAEILDNY